MAIKDVLVHVGDKADAGPVVDAALALSAQCDAHLVGLGIHLPLYLPGYATLRVPQSILEIIEKREKLRVAEARELFESKARKFGREGRSEWRADRGMPNSAIATHGRYSDLIVVSQHNPAAEVRQLDDLAEALLFSAGRPILVIPYIGAAQSIGKRVLVAWNASREAARAVADAMPILEAADSVEVFVVDETGSGETPGADIATHLAHHGVHVDVYHAEPGTLSVGDHVLNRAADTGADLVVMGGYGHSRLRESVLGGATRHILQHMTVPVLMSH